jgi:hypothetical protein
MKRFFALAAVLLALAVVPVGSETVMSFGLGTGIIGYLNDADGRMFLPIDISVHYRFYPRFVLRAEIGPAFSLRSPDRYLDTAFGVEIPIASDFYGAFEVLSWANGTTGYEDIILGIKAGGGYLWKGFFAECWLPLSWDEDGDILVGWEIRGGWRYSIIR